MKEYRSTSIEYEELYNFDDINGNGKDAWSPLDQTQLSRPKYNNDITRLPPIDKTRRPARKTHGKGDERIKNSQPNIFGMKHIPHPPTGPIPRCPDGNRRRMPEINTGLQGRRPIGKARPGPEIKYEEYPHDAPTGPRPKFVSDNTRLPQIDNGSHRHRAYANRHTQRHVKPMRASVDRSESYNACRLPEITPAHKKLDIEAEYEELMAGHGKDELENNPWVMAYEKKNGLRKTNF